MAIPKNSRWMTLPAIAATMILILTGCELVPLGSSATSKAPPAAADYGQPSGDPATGNTPGASGPSGTPIKVGLITPLSGPVAQYGYVVRIASKMAESDINAAGGINGCPIQLQIEDSPFDPQHTVTALRKLADQDKVFAVVGPYASAEMDVAAPLANQLKIPVLSTSTKIGQADNNRPWAFQMNVQDSVNTPPAIEAYMKLHPEVRNVVLTGDAKGSVTEYMINTYLPRLLKEKGLNLITAVPFDTGLTDFGAVVTKIKNANPQGIVVAALMPEAVGLAKELQRQQVTAPVVADGHPTGGPIVELGGDALEGWVMPTYFNWDNPDPRAQSFVKRFNNAVQADANIKPKPAHLVLEPIYYDTLTALADIMRKAGIDPDTPLQEARDKVMQGLTNLKDYQGIEGPLTMQSNGNLSRQPPPAFVAQKGKYQILR